MTVSTVRRRRQRIRNRIKALLKSSRKLRDSLGVPDGPAQIAVVDLHQQMADVIGDVRDVGGQAIVFVLGPENTTVLNVKINKVTRQLDKKLAV